MAIRGVLFDWGGTLVRDDSLRPGAAAAAVANYATERLGLELTADAFERAFHAVLPEYRPGVTETAPNLPRLLGGAFTWLGLPVSASAVENCARLFFTESTHGLDLYDDARALLGSLRYRGFKVGVVTNSVFPAYLFEPKLTELGIAGYVDSFVASADVGLSKPNPGPFLAALNQLDLEPHEAIFVGDMAETDIAGAKAAGMRAVLLVRDDRARDRAGFLVIERLSALNDLLGEGPAR